MRLLAATEMCGWCRREIAAQQMQVAAPSGSVLHWSCALMAADRGLLERQPRTVDGELVPA